jgi:hypothetical protein
MKKPAAASADDWRNFLLDGREEELMWQLID